VSTHAVALGPFDSVTAGPSGLLELVTAQIRKPDQVTFDAANGQVVYTFTVDLTAAEVQTFADCVGTTRTRNVSITLAEYRAIRGDLANLRTFLGLATPTAAQTAAATKSVIRVLAALLRS